MSVLVKGMDMPLGCIYCTFCSYSSERDWQGAKYCCTAPVYDAIGGDLTDLVRTMYDYGRPSRPDWCPLQEVEENDEEI